MKLLPNLNQVTPIFHVHAHNDNEQPNPLVRALSHGVTYIEADIWLKKGKLFAQHGRPYLTNSNKLFVNNYLAPLFDCFQRTGAIFKNTSAPLTLVLDIKSDAVETYHAILQELKPYQSMLTRWVDNKKITNSVSILLSGHRSFETVTADKNRWVQLDGRMSDIGKNYHPELVPMISDKYSKVAGWRPFAKTPNEKQLRLLKEVADKIHSEGKLFRLWKIPENREAIQLFRASGVDVVSLDDLSLAVNDRPLAVNDRR